MYKNKKGEKKSMQKADKKALEFICAFLDLKDVLLAAAESFENKGTLTDSESADICLKVINAFLD